MLTTSSQLSVCGKIPRLFGSFPEVILGNMPRSLYHWTYEDVTEFLTARGFEFYGDVEGIGRAWMNFQENGEPNRIVEVKYSNVVFKPKQLKRMIRQSGIPEAEWLN
jgi:hypothetical protein